MKSVFVVSALAAVWLASVSSAERVARADDAPTFADHPEGEARDDDRTLCVLLNPLAMAMGVYGAEADVVVGKYAALGFEGGVWASGGSAATALGVAVLIYPQGAPLHGLVLAPRVVYARPMDEAPTSVDASREGFGVGATAGWQWTWDYGLSVRLGGGAMYVFGASSAAPGGPIAGGAEVVVDGSVGWAF